MCECENDREAVRYVICEYEKYEIRECGVEVFSLKVMLNNIGKELKVTYKALLK